MMAQYLCENNMGDRGQVRDITGGQNDRKEERNPFDYGAGADAAAFLGCRPPKTGICRRHTGGRDNRRKEHMFGNGRTRGGKRRTKERGCMPRTAENPCGIWR